MRQEGQHAGGHSAGFRIAVGETHHTRTAYGETLLRLGRENPNVVALDADLACSTKSIKFGNEFPDRFFQMGIAESNTMGAAAGMAAGGRTVIACSYGVFISMRAVEAIRTFVCYPNLNVKFLSSHGGVTAAIDGVTHAAAR